MVLSVLETRRYMAPRRTAYAVHGKAFVHSVVTATGAETCETPWPEPECRCGYHTLHWAVFRADLGEGGSAA